MKVVDKVSISYKYQSEVKDKYLKNTKPKNKNRYAIITGAHGNNMCASIGNNIEFYNNAWLDVKPVGNNQLNNPHSDFFQLDVTDETAVESVFKKLKENKPDTIIIGHGDMQLKWFEDYSFGEYEHLINTNLTSHLKIIKLFIDMTIEYKFAKYIIIIGSMGYDNVLNGSTPYCVAKAGLAMLVRCLAWELAPKNYNVMGIHPSNTQDTPMTEKTISEIMKFRNVNHESAEKYWGAICPRDQFLTKKEIYELVIFFLGGKCNYLSGANIELGGGQR